MSKSWQQRSEGERRAIERIFTGLEQAADLTSGGKSGNELGVDFGTLYRYASGRITAPAGLNAALLRQPALRRTLRQLLAQSSRHHVRRAAAASSGDLDSREAGGILIRIKPSRVEAGQVYVLIESTDGSPLPSSLAILGPGGCERFDLPSPSGDVVQVLTEQDSALVRGLRDHANELYLR